MKKIVRLTMVIGVLAIIFGDIWCSWANGDERQYELTRDRIKQAWIVDNPDRTSDIVVELTETAAKEFAVLTEANVGRSLAIVWSGQVLMRPVVKAKIESGIINISRWRSEEEAKAFLNKLLPASR